MKADLTLSDILASVMSPVTLITGVAFLTSIMAPRFDRCIDRIRNILIRIKDLPIKNREHTLLILQLKILYRRTWILRNSMVAAGVCVLLVVITIAATFSNLLFGVPNTGAPMITFCLALISLMLLVVGFIFDFMNSLQAVKLEISSDLSIDELGFIYREMGTHRNILPPHKTLNN